MIITHPKLSHSECKEMTSPVALSLDEQDHAPSTLSAEPSPASPAPSSASSVLSSCVKVDSSKSELCRRFLEWVREIRHLPEGSYCPSANSAEVFDVRHTGTGEDKEVMVEVVHRSEQCLSMDAAISAARQGIEYEIAKRQQDIQALDQDILTLQDKVREGGEDVEQSLAQLGHVLMVQGKHRKCLLELEARKEAEVVLEVDRSYTRVALAIGATQETTTHERRKVSLQDAWLYAVGGWDGSAPYLSSVERYDGKSRSWQPVSKMSQGRYGCAAVALDHHLIVMGGADKLGSHLSSVERYDQLQSRWVAVAPMSSKRREFAAAVVDEEVYAIGGWDGAFSLSLVERYSLHTDSWKEVASLTYHRNGCAAAVLEGKIYALGGYDDGYLNEVEVYDAKRNHWKLATPMKERRYRCAAVVFGGMLYAIGGENEQSRLSSVERFDPRKNKWEMMSPMECQRESCAAAVMGGYIYVSGGRGGGDAALNSVERYDPKRNVWQMMQGSMSSARQGHALVQGLDSVLSGRIQHP